MQSVDKILCILLVWGLFCSALVGQDSLTIPVTVTGSVRSHAAAALRGSGATFDGDDYVDCVTTSWGGGSFRVEVVNVNGGKVNGKLTQTVIQSSGLPSLMSGAGYNETTVVNQNSGYQISVHSSNLFMVRYKPTSWGDGKPTDTTSGEQFTVAPGAGSSPAEGESQVMVTWEDHDGGAGDVIVVKCSYTGSLVWNNSSVSNSSSAPPTVYGTIYVNGPPPEGRAAPTGGITSWDEPSEDFNNHVEGAFTNNSSQDQRIEVWADTGPGGEPELIGYAMASPGATTNLDIGANLPPGVEAYVRASGEFEGDIDITSMGGKMQMSINGAFPVQAPRDFGMTIENSTGEMAGLTVGNPDVPLDILSFPPGVSEIGRTYSSGGTGSTPMQVSGGSTVHTSGGSSGGSTQQIIAIPATGGTAQVIGSATVPTPTGQQTVQIVQLPSGSQIAVGGGMGPAPVPPQTPSTGTGSGGVASTSSDLADEAAAQLMSIRASFSAAAAMVSGVSDTGMVTGDQIEAAGDALETGVERLNEAKAAALGFFGSLSKDLDLPTGIGTKSNFPLTILGNTYVMEFDSPFIAWFRTVLLFVVCLLWFKTLLSFAKT